MLSEQEKNSLLTIMPNFKSGDLAIVMSLLGASTVYGINRLDYSYSGYNTIPIPCGQIVYVVEENIHIHTKRKQELLKCLFGSKIIYIPPTYLHPFK